MSADPRLPPAMQPDATRCRAQKNLINPVDLYVNTDKHLSERQKTAIELLLQGGTDAQVAQQIGVDRVTVFRWRKNPAFAREMERQRARLWEQSAGRLHSMVDPALDILQKQLAGDDPKTALRAAAILLRFANPSRLARPARASDPEDDYFKSIEAYVNSPLPGLPGAPADLLDDVDDDDDDEDENEDRG